MEVKLNDREFQQLMDDLPDAVRDSWKRSGDYFKDITPKLTGNAQGKTRTQQNVINADYAYAGRLDEGYSRKAPNGMSDPTIDYFVQQLDNYIGRI
jgi:hypothetical protein